MAILYFKNPADGLFYPILGSDVSGKADTTYVDNELAKKLDKVGDTSTGVMNLDDVRIGNVWGGNYKGVQQDGELANDSAALLFGNGTKAGYTYLIGNAGSGRIVLRPQCDGGGTYDVTVTTGGVSLPVYPTDDKHATSKDYADGQGVYASSGTTATTVSTSYVPINFNGTVVGTTYGAGLWSSNYVFRLSRIGLYLVTVRLTIAPRVAGAVASLAIGNSSYSVLTEFSDVYIPANWTWRHNAAIFIVKTTTANEEYSILAKNSGGSGAYNYNTIYVTQINGALGT